MRQTAQERSPRRLKDGPEVGSIVLQRRRRSGDPKSSGAGGGAHVRRKRDEFLRMEAAGRPSRTPGSSTPAPGKATCAEGAERRDPEAALQPTESPRFDFLQPISETPGGTCLGKGATGRPSRTPGSSTPAAGEATSAEGMLLTSTSRCQWVRVVSFADFPPTIHFSLFYPSPTEPSRA